MSNAAAAGGMGRDRIDIEALWKQYHDRVYHWQYEMVGNAEDANDLTDCTFVRVWQRRDRFDSTRSSLCKWLYLNAHTVATAFRRRKRVRMLSLDLMEDMGTEPSCAGPAELYAAAERRARVWRAVDELPDVERAILRGHYHDGLSWAEVAEKTGKSLRSVMFHAARAIQLLRVRLAEQL